MKRWDEYKLRLIINNGKELPPRPWGYKLERGGDGFITDYRGLFVRFNPPTAQYLLDCINRFDGLVEELLSLRKLCIESEEHHRILINRIRELMNAEVGSQDEVELDYLSRWVEEAESRFYPIEKPTK